MASVDTLQQGLNVSTHTLSVLFNYSSHWNIILLIIGGCSILSFTIFFERLLTLRKSEIDTNKFIIGLRKVIKEGNIVEATRLCENTKGTISSIVKSGLSKHDKGREQIENVMEVSGLLEIAKLEKNAKILSIIAYIYSHIYWIYRPQYLTFIIE